MRQFLVRRIVESLLALLAVTLIVFLLARVTGNPADVLLPAEASPEEFQRMTERFGLDRPWYVQLGLFLANAARGDFGQSTMSPGVSAFGVVIQRLPATLQLAGLSILIATLIAVPLGVIAGTHKDTRVDRVSKVIGVTGQSIPAFWLAIIFIWVFSVQLGWFPTSGAGGVRHMILPAIALGWYHVAAVLRLTRSGILETLDSEYIKLARLKGLPEWRVIWKHALRNAAIVPLTYFGIILGVMLTGSVVVETVFSWPGTGRLAVDAVRGRDFPVVQAVVFVFALIFVISNLIIDIVYAYIDPRVRLGGSGQ